MVPSHLISRGALPLDANTHLSFDGNSLFAGVGATGSPLQNAPNQVMALPAFAGTGQGPSDSPYANVAVSGHTWAQMLAHGVDNTWAQGKRNLLLLWETTNTLAGGKTPAQNFADAKAYIAARRAAKPWIIGVLTSLPKEGPDSTLIGSANEFNASLVAADNMFRTRRQELGADFIVDTRLPGSPFAFTGYTAADFTACGLYFEAVGSRVHLTNAGYAVIAQMIRDQVVKNVFAAPHQ